ncbi:glycosyltransferase family 2 protein [uncultured Thomasclavelia sp.]|uniref:glycosyltransferase n=1 Tax=uncultured Thomasclavelia sp. TaxID=3025759 RepID=UPI00261F9651|nr:glycosyltransferase family 2 protein [uncultured Thomasclavelia sp.]
MSIKISVIIPVYNVEEYLNRCVDSVINQTLTDLEIILVDDGSPDKCPQLCDELMKHDSRIKVIHKKNGGLSSARNAGLRIAAGKYVFFLDSDDWLELDGLKILYETIEKYQVDFVRYRAIRTNWPGMKENEPVRLEPIREMRGGLYNKQQIISEIYPRLIVTNQLTMGPIVGAWGSIYNRSFLMNNNLFFDEKVKFSEDMIFSAKVVVNASNFYYLDNACVYHYFYNPLSISKSFRKDRWESCRYLVTFFEEYFKDADNYDFSFQLKRLRWFCILIGLNEKRYLSSYKQKKQYCKNIVNDDLTKKTKLVLTDLNVGLKLKLYLILIKFKAVNFISRI